MAHKPKRWPTHRFPDSSAVRACQHGGYRDRLINNLGDLLLAYNYFCTKCDRIPSFLAQFGWQVDDHRPQMAPKGQAPKGKGPKSKITAADVGCYNKGRRDAAGVQEQRWFLRTKKKENRVTSFSPKYVGPPGDRFVEGFHGVWDSEEGARGGIEDFVLHVNGSLEVRARQSPGRLRRQRPRPPKWKRRDTRSHHSSWC